MPYVATRLGRWFYEVSGSASNRRPLVLLHGLFLDGDLWRHQLPALRARHLVYVFDMPGHGRSDVPPAFTLEEQAAALAEAMVTLDLHQATIVGLSWGGMVAMRMALLYPELVSALGLLSTTAEAERPALRVVAGALSRLAAEIGVSPRLFDWRIAPLMYGANARRLQPELVAAAKARVLRMDRRALAHTVDAVVTDRTAVLPRLYSLRVPTLVVCGDADDLTPLRRSERIAREIPGAELTVLPQIGHLCCEEAPDAVTVCLTKWLDALDV
jgi:3-oxoadipate enol-lactonase